MASKPTIFIDGEHGTTGLQIREQLALRQDLELVSLPKHKAKDEALKREMVNGVDVVMLCLPDEAARNTVALIEQPRVRVIDASTAHRTAPGWVYGFAELTRSQRARIRDSKRIANPGCYPTGFLALIRPLREAGVIGPEQPLSVHAVSGYSGGGRKMIETYESSACDDACRQGPPPQAFGTYGLNLAHKHVPEMTLHGLLTQPPIFSPAVGAFLRGMLVHVPLHVSALAKPMTGDDLHAIYRAHFAGESFVTVRPLNDYEALRAGQFLEPEALNGSNQLEVFVYASQTQAMLVARLDNLGKGASGAAVQNLNLVLGWPDSQGFDQPSPK